MSISAIKKTFVIISIAGTIISVGHRSSALPISPFVARAQEALEETEAQQFAKDEINRRRSELKGAFEERRVQFIEQLQNVLNEGKRQIALQASDAINEINTRKTDQYLELIGRVDSILQAISVRVEALGQTGSNIEEIWPKIMEANRTIADARGLVMSQSGVIYNIEGGAEEGLATEVKNARNNLYTDIGNIRAKVKDSWNATKEVIKAFNEANKQ